MIVPLTFLSILGVNLAFGIIATWLLPVRHRAAFLTAMVALALPTAGGGAFSVNMGAFNVVGYLVNYMAIPYLFWDAARVHRIICAAILVLIEIVTEALLSFVFSALGIPFDRSLSTWEHAALRCGCIAAALTIGRLFASTVSRTLRCVPRRTGSADVPTRAPVTRTAATSAVSFVPQLICVFAILVALFRADSTAPELYLLLLGLDLLCLGVDAYLLFANLRATTSASARTRAAALESQLAIHVGAARAMCDHAEAAARFRHDQRNHLQVILSLIDGGETERARSYLASLREGNRP